MLQVKFKFILSFDFGYAPYLYDMWRWIQKLNWRILLLFVYLFVWSKSKIVYQFMFQIFIKQSKYFDIFWLHPSKPNKEGIESPKAIQKQSKEPI